MTRDRGSVLILTLFVLTVLSLVALSLTYRTGLETRAARHEAIRVKLRALSRSAVAATLSELAANTNDFDHPAEPWHTHPPLASYGWLPELSGATEGAISGSGEAEYAVTYRVIDEDGKLHVSHASSEDLEKCGLTRPQIDALLDWTDSDATARAEGAEDEFYRSLITPYRPKNAEIEVLEELLLIRGFTREAFLGGPIGENLSTTEQGDSSPAPVEDEPVATIDVLTTVGDGKVNLNTAPKAVLQTLPISAEAVDQILGYRAFDADSRGELEDHIFRSAEDIEQLQGLTDADREVLTGVSKFASKFYRVAVESRHWSTGLRHRVHLLVHMGDHGPEVIQWH